jgi:hypothetical protein
MRSRIVICFLSLLLIVDAAAPCFGQKKITDETMTVDQIKARVAEAAAKDKRLIVLFKNGSSVSGVVSSQSDHGFSITDAHGILGNGDKVTPIAYSDVSRLKWRNPFVKALKNAGVIAGIAVGTAVLFPIWAALEGLSLLMTGETLPSCSIGN